MTCSQALYAETLPLYDSQKRQLGNAGMNLKQPRLPVSPVTRALPSSLAARASNGPSMTTHRYFFSNEEVQHSLYSRNEVKPVDVSEFGKKASFLAEDQAQLCEPCKKEHPIECPHHGLQHMRRKSPESNKNTIPRAMETCPNEVQLCVSSIPGAGYGLCAKQHIPVGTWIGPYEGTRIRPDDVNVGMDTSYLWEIFQEGQLAWYIDGSDENVSSWMRYIRCARHRGEQNLFAFQYLGNIYYRAFKEISQGSELLAWYDENYPQYMGIPISVHDMAGVNIEDRNSPPADVSVMAASSSHSKNKSVQEAEYIPQASHTPKTGSVHSGRTPNSIRYDLVAPSRIRRASFKVESMFDLPPQATSTTATTTAGSVHTSLSTANNTSPPGSTRDLQALDIPQDQSEDFSFSQGQMDYSPTTSRSPSSPEALEIGLWKCGQCGKMFAQRTLLQVHICPCAPKKPYQCGHCPESFSQPNDLRNHVAIHTGEKPFKCGYCSRSFSGATTLNNHIRMHTGEKPFVCERCGKTFSQGSQLSKHHKIPGDCI